jgi:hypothetical protein
MATPTLVDRRIEHGADLLAALDRAGVPVDSAFWLYSSEWDEWRLVLATLLYDRHGPLEAYRRIQDVLYATEGMSFRLDRVMAVGTQDQRVRDLRSAFRTWPLHLGDRLEDRFVQGRDVEDSYVYRLSPPPEKTLNGAARGRRSARNGAG